MLLPPSQNRVKDPQLIKTWETAAQYHLVHSLLLTVTPLLSGSSHTYSTRLLSAGMVLFSGSLYALVLTGEKRLGAVTPLGGTALIAGWSVLSYCTLPIGGHARRAVSLTLCVPCSLLNACRVALAIRK